MCKSWYLLCYRYGHGTQAISNLERLGVRCFSPRKKSTSITHPKQIKNIADKEHLFPPYLFVEFDPGDILFSSIKCTPGVKNFVSFGHQVKPIKHDIIDLLMKNESENKALSDFMSAVISCKDNIRRVMMFLSLLAQIDNGNQITLNPLNNSQGLYADNGVI